MGNTAKLFQTTQITGERNTSMKMNKKSIGVLVAVLAVGIASLAFAHGGYGGGYGMGSGYGGMMGPGYGGGYMMGPGYGGMMGPGYGGGYMMGPGYGGMMGQGYGGGYMMGPGYGGMMGPGYGGPMMGYGPGYGPYMNGPGAWGNLPEKDAAALNESQEKFFNETRDLRSQIQEKQIALNNALAGTNPDEGKVIQLQKELSGLQAKFDQKAIAHQLEVRKLLPKNFNQGAHGRGYGYGGYNW
jgi:hypothetical protein